MSADDTREALAMILRDHGIIATSRSQAVFALAAHVAAVVAEKDAEIERLRADLDDRFEHSPHQVAKFYGRMRTAEREVEQLRADLAIASGHRDDYLALAREATGKANTALSALAAVTALAEKTPEWSPPYVTVREQGNAEGWNKMLAELRAALAPVSGAVAKREQEVRADDDTTVRLTQQEFDALRDYSSSLPTGATIGKQWKRRNDYYDESKGWRLGEYVEHDNPDLVGIRWRAIEIVPAARIARTTTEPDHG